MLKRYYSNSCRTDRLGIVPLVEQALCLIKKKITRPFNMEINV